MQPNNLSLEGNISNMSGGYQWQVSKWWLKALKFQKINGAHPSWTRSDVDFKNQKSRNIWTNYEVVFFKIPFSAQHASIDTDLFMMSSVYIFLQIRSITGIGTRYPYPAKQPFGPWDFGHLFKKDMNHLPSTDSQGRLVSFREVLCIGFFSGNHGKIRSSSVLPIHVFDKRFPLLFLFWWAD